jgi:hypothetical protein
MGARSLAQILCPAIPPDCSVIERLSTGLLGRILSGLDDHAEYLVGTSNTPTLVEHDFMAFGTLFDELGSWAALEAPTDDTLTRLLPIDVSPARTALLSAHRLGDGVPVYVLYIYHRVCSAP